MAGGLPPLMNWGGELLLSLSLRLLLLEGGELGPGEVGLQQGGILDLKLQ